MIINIMKNLDYQASPRLDMIINVMKINIKKERLSSKSGTRHGN